MSAIALEPVEELQVDTGLEVPTFVQPSRERRLHTVAPGARKRKSPLRYALTAVVLIAAITAAQVSIALMTTQESFVLADRVQQHKQLQWEQQAIESEVVALGSPQVLGQHAAASGLVVNGSPQHMRLSDGALIGATTPAVWRSAVNPENASVANALVDTPLVVSDQAAWDAVLAAGVRPPTIETLPVPQLRGVAPLPVPEAVVAAPVEGEAPATEGETVVQSEAVVEGNPTPETVVEPDPATPTEVVADAAAPTSGEELAQAQQQTETE